nr:hypothetical protein GCM10020185_16610 [Pseudomonas brassicacearum subsp. brassicacearum]
MAEALLSHQHTGLQASGAQIVLQRPRHGGLRHHGKPRRVTYAQGQQLTHAREATEGEHLVTLRMPTNDVKRTQADRTGRTKDRDLLGATHDAAIHNSTAKIGIAAVRLSMRSSTPP